MNLHILHVATFPYPSTQGSQVYVRSLLKGLASLGHRVSLLCYAHGDSEVQWDDPEITILRIPQVFGYDNLRAGPDAIKIVLDLLMAISMLKEEPDIIHVHNYEAPIVATIGRYHRKIPMVYSAHNTMKEELPTYFHSKSIKRCAKFVGQILDVSIPRLADAAIVIRRDSITKLRDLGCRKVFCIEPSIDVDEFLYHPIQLPEGKWMIYAGNPDNYQDLQVLMDALLFLDEDIRLILIGKSSFDSWVHKDISHRVICIQTSSFAEVVSHIAAADVAVIPRSICSGFPIKILNYLAVGTPVVVAEGSDVGLRGCVSFVNGQSQSMAEVIAKLFEDNRLSNLGKEGKEQVLSEYTWQKSAKKLEKVYLSLLCDIEK